MYLSCYYIALLRSPLTFTDNPHKPPPQGLPPTVTPSEWSGTSGDIVRLICTPSQRANITWTRSGGLPLPYAASQRDGVLTITNPSPSDSGIYVCTATSIRGTETSTSARITIVTRREPPTIKVKPERQDVSQGTIAEVRCITGGEPGVQVKWSKYTEPMSTRVQQVGDTLRIVNAQVSDRGVYICRVTSPTGTYEASAIIEVEREFVYVYIKTSNIFLSSQKGETIKRHRNPFNNISYN